MALTVGDRAPAVPLPCTDGETISLDSLSGRKAVLYFYPKDDTSGCTRRRWSSKPSRPSSQRTRRWSGSRRTASRATTSSARNSGFYNGPCGVNPSRANPATGVLLLSAVGAGPLPDRVG